MSCLERLLAVLSIVLAGAVGRPTVVAAQIPTAAIGTRCIAMTGLEQGAGPEDYRECTVSESGPLGTVAKRTLHFALYCILPRWAEPATTCGDDSFQARYHRARGLAVFSQEPGGAVATVLFVRAEPEIGIVSYLKPQLLRTAAGTVLHLPIAIDGTGNGNSSEYYMDHNGEWDRLESETWLQELASRLPQGLEIWKGIWPNLETMTAESGLYRRGDGNCCPTGGVARIRLAIQGRRLVLDSLSIEPPR